jgi:hypothetical protein
MQIHATLPSACKPEIQSTALQTERIYPHLACICPNAQLALTLIGCTPRSHSPSHSCCLEEALPPSEHPLTTQCLDLHAPGHGQGIASCSNNVEPIAAAMSVRCWKLGTAGLSCRHSTAHVHVATGSCHRMPYPVARCQFAQAYVQPVSPCKAQQKARQEAGEGLMQQPQDKGHSTQGLHMACCNSSTERAEQTQGAQSQGLTHISQVSIELQVSAHLHCACILILSQVLVSMHTLHRRRPASASAPATPSTRRPHCCRRGRRSTAAICQQQCGVCPLGCINGVLCGFIT